MIIRTIEKINMEIEEAEAITRIKTDKLKQEMMLIEALNFCKNDDERAIVKRLGPEFINQYFSQLISFTGCACEGFERSVLKEIGLSIGVDNLVGTSRSPRGIQAAFIFLLTNERSSDDKSCYYRHGLVRAYCLVKNNFTILEKIAEELKAKKAR